MRAMRHMWSDILRQVVNLAIEFRSDVYCVPFCMFNLQRKCQHRYGDLEVINIRPHVSTQIAFVSALISEMHTSDIVREQSPLTAPAYGEKQVCRALHSL